MQLDEKKFLALVRSMPDDAVAGLLGEVTSLSLANYPIQYPGNYSLYQLLSQCSKEAGGYVFSDKTFLPILEEAFKFELSFRKAFSSLPKENFN